MASLSATPGSDQGSPPRGNAPGPRIVAASARLIHQRGVAGTTLEDVKAADISGSQLCRYLPDKDDLVQAVVGYQADTAANNQRQADFGSVEGLGARRDMLIKTVRTPRRGEAAPSGRSAGSSRKAIPKPAHSSPPDSRSGLASSVTGSGPHCRQAAPGPASIPTISPSPSSPRCEEACSSRLQRSARPWNALSARPRPRLWELNAKPNLRTREPVSGPRCWQGQDVPP
jgi:Bacterial regulatory proteins, tetR family